MLSQSTTVTRTNTGAPSTDAELEASRELVLTQIRQRQGPVDLRQRLLKGYLGCCAISGCDLVETLDVVLIIPSNLPPATQAANALLLRTDLHTLFDLYLLTIDPTTLTVVIAPELRRSTYADLDGQVVKVPTEGELAPDRRMLAFHYDRMRARVIEKFGVDNAPPARATMRTMNDFQSAPPPSSTNMMVNILPLERQTINVRSWVNSVAFSPNGDILATGSWDGSARIWRTSDAYLVNTLSGNMGEVNSVAFSPNGALVVVGNRGHALQIWNVADGRLLRTITQHEGAVFGVAFSPDGQTLASASWDRTVRIWNFADGNLARTLGGHGGAVNAVTYSADGRLLASGSHDSNARIWRVADGQLLYTLSGHQDAVFSVAFSPNGQFLATGCCDRTVRIWRVADGKHLGTLTGHNGPVFSVAFSPNGQVIASGDYDRTIRLWRVTDGEPLNSAQRHGEGITSLSFSPDGVVLASGSFDATVRLWQIAQ